MINHVTCANCKCSKELNSKLFEECSENIDGKDMINKGTLNDHRKVCNSCTIYIWSYFS